MNDSDDGPITQMQRLAHTIGSFPGFSGSPIFLPNGHVVGLNNSGFGQTEGNRTENLSFGVRIDCLWELLAYHGLDSKVAIPVDVASLKLDRFNQTSESLVTLNKARDLVAQATIAFGERKYQDSLKLAQQASDVLGTYAPAYQAEANVWEYYTMANNLAADQKVKNWTEAVRCRHNVVILNPSDIDAAVDWLGANKALRSPQMGTHSTTGSTSHWPMPPRSTASPNPRPRRSCGCSLAASKTRTKPSN